MKSMMYMSLFWKIHYNHRKNIEQQKREKICKQQFTYYLKYLESKDIKITDYISVGDSLIN